MINYDTYYLTTVARFQHPAGTLVVRQTTHDYGLARDDTEYTGIKHVSVTALDSEGGFTIGERYLEHVCSTGVPMDEVLVLVAQARKNIDPEQHEPEQQFIDGKKIRPYIEWYQQPVVGETAILFYGESVYRTSTVAKIDGDTIHTQNTVYVRETE